MTGKWIPAVGQGGTTITIILSLLTEDYILQVSDRRLTRMVNGNAQVVDDESNKAVLFGTYLSIAYTGLATLPRTVAMGQRENRGLHRAPTNVWLAEALRLGKSLDECLESLRRQAELAHGRLHSMPPGARLQAFVGVGWTRFDDSSESLVPTLHQVDNLADRKRFVRHTVRLDSEYGVHSSKPLRKDVDEKLHLRIGVLIERGSDMHAAGSALIDAVRESAEFDKTIGTGVLLSCIPRAQAERAEKTGEWAIDPTLSRDNLSYTYVPPGRNSGTAHGPTLLLPDGSILGQIVIGAGVTVRASFPQAEPDDLLPPT